MNRLESTTARFPESQPKDCDPVAACAERIARRLFWEAGHVYIKCRADIIATEIRRDLPSLENYAHAVGLLEQMTKCLTRDEIEDVRAQASTFLAGMRSEAKNG